ncbi:MAG: mechanosensitive ion channel family protein [Gammaproteobacteria bacterium]|nr:mechanosensitive ion channel family protein [Gammaproteobacteria bacterium]MBU2675922.1 mechanosensitive ion channel family protein [Gammaproteobacteria bacterium]NNC56729.1 mechanosensitive ion channel family protein [Woeseiaceae bacterium]NNL49658.1 mechanosensitive ion channel family protein [Woeseiaceae bacterium]
MNDPIAKVQQLAELIGPNLYLQAVIIAAIFIFIGKIADWIISGILGRIASRSTNNFDDQFIRLLHRPVFLSFVLLGLALAARRIEMPDTPLFITLGILKTIAIFVWYSTLNSLLNLLIVVFGRSKDSKILETGMQSLLHNVLKIVLVALTVYFIFLAWQIDVTAWLASAGIVGLALSFAAKDTLSNLFAGVSIIMDAPYKTGDFIILDSGERGIVTNIGLRSTRILTRDDIEITVPNGIIGNGKIINEAGGPSEQHRIRVAVGVAYGSDIDHVISTLENVANDNADIVRNPEARVRFRSFGDSSLNFELLGWIARPVDRGRVTHELNCAIYKAFKDNNIEIPFPQRDLHVRTMPQTES